MRHLDTRTLQQLLRNSQIALSTCTGRHLKEAYKLYICELATELLYRYQQNKN